MFLISVSDNVSHLIFYWRWSFGQSKFLTTAILSIKHPLKEAPPQLGTHGLFYIANMSTGLRDEVGASASSYLSSIYLELLQKAENIFELSVRIFKEYARFMVDF